MMRVGFNAQLPPLVLYKPITEYSIPRKGGEYQYDILACVLIREGGPC